MTPIIESGVPVAGKSINGPVEVLVIGGVIGVDVAPGGEGGGVAPGGGGGGGAATIADGADVAEGATTDAAITAFNYCTDQLIAKPTVALDMLAQQARLGRCQYGISLQGEEIG